MRRFAKFVGLLALVMMLSAEAFGCEQAARPAVRISLAETPAEFDLTHSVADLSRMPVDTQSPYPSHYHTEVGGVMNGEITLEHRVVFNRDAADGRECVILKEIIVELSISPTIYIASDYQSQTCLFKQIFAHESKHVEIDRALVRKYEGRIADAMNMMLMMPADYSSGWLDPAEAEGVQYDMQVGLENALEVLFNKMMRERNERQQEVDSLDEYTRITRACQVSS